jgi:hypothetical protein
MLARPWNAGTPTTRKASWWLPVCGGGLVVMGIRGVDVFWPHADADCSGWNPAQHRELLQQTEEQRELLDGRFVTEGRPDEIFVDEDLGGLSHPGGKLAALLNGAARFVKRSVGEQRLRQRVRGGHGILNR